MSLNNVLQKLRAVRSKLNTSVQQKGVDIPDNSTLYTIDKGVNQIQQGVGDTSEFQSDMIAVIGDDANIPPVLVSGAKFYKCAYVNTPQRQETETIATDKPTYVVSNAGLSEEVNGTYTYMGQLEDPSYFSTCLLWKNTKDNGYYIYYGGFGWVIVTGRLSNNTSFTPNVPPLYVIVQYIEGHGVYGYLDEYAGQGTFEPYLVETGTTDGIAMTYAAADSPSQPEITTSCAGYELVLENGKYTVSDTLTEGLTYSAMPPKVNEVYTADALIKVGVYYTGMPTDGLVFYAPLTSQKSTDDTGKALYYNGTYSFAENAFDTTGDGYINTDACSWFPQGNNPWTISFKFKSPEVLTKAGVLGMFLMGTTNDGKGVAVYLSSNAITLDTCGSGGREYDIPISYPADVWNTITISYLDNNMRFYLNGDSIQSLSVTLNTDVTRTPLYIGKPWHYNFSDGGRFGGLIKDLAFYNRALSQEEITLLAQ